MGNIVNANISDTPEHSNNLWVMNVDNIKAATDDPTYDLATHIIPIWAPKNKTYCVKPWLLK